MEKGQLELVFWPHYKANGAGERSQQIAEAVIENSGLSQDKKKRFVPLVQHLIRETKFVPGEKAPFSVFARVVDQIGGNLFSSNPNKEIGFLEEMCAEDPYSEIPPAFVYNFPRRRFGQLVADENVRKDVLKIWGKELPERKEDLEEELIHVSRYSEEHKRKSLA